MAEEKAKFRNKDKVPPPRILTYKPWEYAEDSEELGVQQVQYVPTQPLHCTVLILSCITSELPLHNHCNVIVVSFMAAFTCASVYDLAA